MVLPGYGFHVSTSTVPRVWASAYHDGIVWCNQLLGLLATMLNHMAADEHFGPPGQSPGAVPPDGVVPGDGGDPTSNPRADRSPSWRRSLVKAYVDKYLVGQVWGQIHDGQVQDSDPDTGHIGSRPMTEPGSGSGRSSVEAVREAAAGSVSPGCGGTNHVWYLQYLTPKEVTGRLLQLDHASIKVGGRVMLGFMISG